MGSVKCILLGVGLKDEFPRKPGRNPSVVPGGLLGQPQPQPNAHGKLHALWAVSLHVALALLGP